MKRLIALLLALAAAASLSSCKAKPNSPVEKPTTDDTEPPKSEDMIDPTEDDGEEEPAAPLTRDETIQLIGEYFKANFPINSTVYEADVTHDGNSDVIVVDKETDPAEIYGYILSVKNGAVQCINDKVGANVHTNNFDWFVSKNEDGPATMFEYTDSMYQGFGTCELVEYYFDDELNRVEVSRIGVGEGWDGTCDSNARVKDDAIQTFYDKVESIVLKTIVLQLTSCPISIDTIHTPPLTATELFGFDASTDTTTTQDSDALTLMDGKCTVEIPSSWEGKYHMEQNDSSVQFYSKSNYDKYEGMGTLVSICFSTDYTSRADLEANAPFPSYEYVGTMSGGVVYVLYPTDVQFDTSNPSLADEYNEMKYDVDELVDSIVLNG